MFADLETVWLWTTILLVVGGCVTTARKTLANISRKGLLDRLSGTVRERFQTYLDSLDDYDVALRFADQLVRMALVACAVFGFVKEGFEATLGSQLQRIEPLVLGNSARLSCLERAVAGLARAKENGSQSAPGGYGGGR